MARAILMILIFLVAAMATTSSWAAEPEAPSPTPTATASPAAKPEVSTVRELAPPGPPPPADQMKEAKPPSSDKLVTPPAKIVVVRETRVVERVPYPHPSTSSGHHEGAGHQPVYQHIKTWNPASMSFVEKRDGRLEAQLKDEQKSRLQGDQALEKKVGSGRSAAVIAIVAIVALIAMIALVRARREN